MLPSCETNVDLDNMTHFDTPAVVFTTKPERSFPALDLTEPTLSTNINQPILVVQSPKTPTLSRKLKASSLDSDPLKPECSLSVARDVASMPNTPKKQSRAPKSPGFEDCVKPLPTTSLGSNLKRFASNSSISGSQTLKTLPEVMTLQDFIDGNSKPDPIRVKAKGLLERRGSNASLTIDLGSSSNISEAKSCNKIKLNSIKSASHLNLTSITSDQCSCNSKIDKTNNKRGPTHSDSYAGCEVVTTRASGLCRNRCYTFHKKCNCLCNFKCRRKSLSNENLYVPPCSFCQTRLPKDCEVTKKNCNGCRRAVYPRQPNAGSNQMLSDDFKMHLQNVQYLQTAGSILSVADLKTSCQGYRVPKLHQEFWEVPLNLQEKCLVSGSQSKNRYKGVLPNEHSRVHLSEPSPYIHANYIKGHDYVETAYIATQGPMEHTCSSFWEMVWLTECKCIVMLTGLIEKGKSKCELYFPLGKSQSSDEKTYFYVTTTRAHDKFTFEARNVQLYEEETIAFEELNEVEFGDYKIEFCRVDSLGECQIRQFKLQKNKESRLIYHYWFSNWQDHKMANPSQVLDIALEVMNFCEYKFDNNVLKSNFKLENANSNKDKVYDVRKINSSNVSDSKITKVPLIVHCSAGIGRTGCFLAILNGIKQLKFNLNVDVLASLCSLRLHRGGMVQTAEQYELIHRVLCLYIDKIESDII